MVWALDPACGNAAPSARALGRRHVNETRPTAQPSDRSLLEAVQAYLRGANDQERARWADLVQRESGGDPRRVAEALRGVTLWEALPRHGSFPVPSADGPLIVAYELPEGYDPGIAYPAILCQPDDGVPQNDTLALGRQVLGGWSRGCIWVCPEKAVGNRFHLSRLQAAEDVGHLIHGLRKTLHTDPDRLFLFGRRAGADAVWMAALLQPDLFAGALTVSGVPQVPFPRHTLALLLDNLAGTGVFSFLSADELDTAGWRASTVKAFHRGIADYARRRSLPIVCTDAWGTHDPRQDGAPKNGLPAEIEILLQKRRSPWADPVAHWFRYPGQGRVRWLHQTGFEGDVWTDDQLSILPSTTSDQDDFIKSVIASKLAHIEGRVNGQVYTIHTQRCAEIEVRLAWGEFDWSQPITVYCNDSKRRHGLVKPRIDTMLETAHEDWDFHRPVAAKLRFRIHDDSN
jgi:pimeloyl-ACP methyl ester carboxylesterase